MYGLEIQRNLRFKGEIVGTGQLYPALNKLEETGAIESYMKARVGADRKYYRITDSGKRLLLEHLRGLLVFFELMGIEHLHERYMEAYNLAALQSGYKVLDFSNPNIERVREEQIPLVKPSGEYSIVNLDPSLDEALNDWLGFEELTEYTSILNREQINELPDESVDVCLALSILHEDNTGWIIEESSRLLRSGGCLVVADLVEDKRDWRTDFLPMFIPNLSKIGLNMEQIHAEISKHGVRLVSERIEKNFVVMKLEKP